MRAHQYVDVAQLDRAVRHPVQAKSKQRESSLVVKVLARLFGLHRKLPFLLEVEGNDDTSWRWVLEVGGVCTTLPCCGFLMKLDLHELVQHNPDSAPDMPRNAWFFQSTIQKERVVVRSPVL